MIIGLDEVGRGCWAGPLVAGAAALPEDFVIEDTSLWRLADSKQLSKLQRETADKELQALGVEFGLGWVNAAEIDGIGISKAVAVAMQRAYESLPSAVRHDVRRVIVDGSINYLPDIPGSEAVIKADGSVPAVSAASILAKVARDNWMAEAAERYPGYGFEKHVGYGTKVHSAALHELGVCELHRRSFKPVAALLG